ncbi:uncharacterized protein LOC113788497 [Dermatophagoides pteronyssinus]|uniref:uncharacterized protein LOC113788497 n=1 Tax=Dermatophagoides pteronyssinus TaxID=6956 RepID=UPI003F66CD0D
MAKQYQCEYCQRSFRDTRKDRQKHRKSQEHLRKKFEYEFYLLKCLVEKFGQKNLELLFNREDLDRLQEVLSKTNGCKYHFAPDKSTTISTLTTRCRYGLHCKHSHQLDDQQIQHYRHYFLNILSRKSIQNQLKQQQQIADWSNISKNQLRKELLLNIWLEKRFKFDPDKRIDLIIGLI